MSKVSRRCVLGVLASCVVHAGIVVGMPRYEQSRERTAQQPVWFELQVEPSAAAHAPRKPPEAAPGVERGTREVHHPASQRRERSARSRPAHVAEEPAPSDARAADAIDAVAVAEQAPGRKPAVTVDLSPQATARTLIDPTSVGARDAGVSHEERPSSGQVQADQLAKQVPGLRASKGPARTGEGVVVDAVEDTLYNVLRPYKLFSRTMGGSEYRYTGAGFDAAILPNGRVRFRDKDGPFLTVMKTQPRREGEANLDPPPSVAWGVSVGDPRAVWYRLRGKDPHAAERRQFLERTRALREYLAGRAAERGAPDTEPKEPSLEPPAAR